MIIAREFSEHGEIVLRTGAAGYEIIADGQFLMSSASGGSSIALIELGLAALPGKRTLQVLIGGLGLGYSLKTAFSHPQTDSILVVELESHLIEWHKQGLIPETAGIINEKQIGILNRDFLEFIDLTQDKFDLIALDIDNGPDWLSHDANCRLYTPDGLGKIQNCLEPGGVVTLWSAAASDSLKENLTKYFRNVTEHVVYDHNGEGKPISVYIYLAR